MNAHTKFRPTKNYLTAVTVELSWNLNVEVPTNTGYHRVIRFLTLESVTPLLLLVKCMDV